MLRAVAISTVALAATTMVAAVDPELSATMSIYEAPMSVDITADADVTIANPNPVKSTKFDFTVDNLSGNLPVGTWAAVMQFDNFAANSTHKYVKAISGCKRGADTVVPVKTNTAVVNGMANTTLSFPITTDAFASVGNTASIICDVTYGFQNTVGTTMMTTAMIKEAATAEATYTDEDVDVPVAKFGSLGSVTKFSATIKSATDLAPYGQALYDKMVADIKAKAASLPQTVAVEVTADAQLTIKGAVVCGLASKVIGTGSGYACVSDLTVTYTGNLVELAKIQDGYAAKIKADMTQLPADTAPTADFATKEVDGTCADGITDNGETDVDCGYDACSNTCEVGQGCAKSLDCATLQCIEGKCSNSAASMSTVAAMAVVAAVAALFF